MLDAMDMPDGEAPEPVLDLDEVLKVDRKGNISIGNDQLDLNSFSMVVDITTFRRGWRCCP